MFTGIIEETGVVKLSKNGKLEIACSFAEQINVGQSVAVNGVCLTVVSRPATTSPAGRQSSVVSFDVVEETLERSTLGSLKEGYEVNLERTVIVGGRLDGHIVQGHTDCVGEVKMKNEKVKNGVVDSFEFVVTVPFRLTKYIVEKGSITVDGISLTVTGVGEDWFRVAVIPHTLEVTNLHTKEVGCKVNIEVDVIAKYVEKLVCLE
jgi:riboflavin synthase